MKTVGMIIFTIDLLKTLYTGYSNVSKEKNIALKEPKGKKDSQHDINWQPYIGMGMMVIGGAFLVLSRKKSLPA
jgi:hypothetical protein